jgi:hypothetical protein
LCHTPLNFLEPNTNWWIFPSPMAQQPLMGQVLLIIEASQSHSDTPYSVGLHWTSDQPDAETTHNTHKKQTSMPPTGFETTIPASERPQNHALDRTASRIGYWWILQIINPLNV